MYEIVRKIVLSDVVKEIDISAPQVAKKGKAGQFVVVRVHEQGERIPLTIADFDREKGTVTLVFQEVGTSTRRLGVLEAGDSLASLTGPLGHASDIRNYGTVVCVGGGVGIAPMYPIARELKQAGNRVISIIGARSKNLLFWEDKMAAISDRLIVCTDDGSYGRKALVTEPLKELFASAEEHIGHTWAIGPAIMMKFCCLTTREFNAPTTVSLNTIMVDGTGMCGACRVKTDTKTYFACVDGPELNGHEIDWDLLLSRQSQYIDQEKQADERYLALCKCRAGS
jgi:ferredoxin/flavodoxin---NADP+ reductase